MSEMKPTVPAKHLEAAAEAHDERLLSEMQGVVQQQQQKPRQPANVVVYDHDTGKGTACSRVDGLDAVRAGNACVRYEDTAYHQCELQGLTFHQIKEQGGGRRALASLQGKEAPELPEPKETLEEEPGLEDLTVAQLKARYKKLTGTAANSRLGKQKLIDAVQEAQAAAAKVEADSAE